MHVEWEESKGQPIEGPTSNNDAEVPGNKNIVIDGTSRAKCNCCNKDYATDSHKNGTSNIINHLLHKCKRFPKEKLDPSQQTLIFSKNMYKRSKRKWDCSNWCSFWCWCM